MTIEKISTLIKYDYFHLTSNNNESYGGKKYTINSNGNLNILVLFNEDGNIRLNAIYKKTNRKKIKVFQFCLFNFVFQDEPTFNISKDDIKFIMTKDMIRVDKFIQSFPNDLIKNMYIFANGM